MKLSGIFDFKWWHLTIIFISFYLMIIYASDQIIYTNAYYYSAYGNQFDIEKIEKIIANRHEYAWLMYVIVSVILFVKFLIVSTIIYIGGFIFNKSLSYKNCLKIVLLAELVPIIAALINFVYLLIHPPATLQDMQYFSPLSLLQLVNVKLLPNYLVYPSKLINVFEAGYWLMLALGVSVYIKDSFKKGLTVVVSSYGVGLLIWVLMVVFIQLQYS